MLSARGLAGAWAGLIAVSGPLLAQVRPAPGADAAPVASGVVRATRIIGSIRLDGVLDEPEWTTADSVADFTQREPEEGAPASERTVARFLAADGGLYVGLWAYDRTPERIRRAQLRRDAEIESDDFLAILFDPQRDRRSAYGFAVNANGAMVDAEVRGQEDGNENWDGVWDARARVTADGWTAELFIPWQTLRYPRNGEGWGLNLFRLIRHRNEQVLWRAWRREQGFFHLQEEGTLVGLGTLPRRRLVEARPFVSTTGALAERAYGADEADSVIAPPRADAALGFDAKVAVAPTLTLDVTANTDFAQVEADRQVVNLTRFPLFFPEKRSFFLEASGIFEFGQAERTQLFHSRRIGLGEGGTPIPIAAGARLTGRVGQERIGLLAMRTGGDEDALNVVARLKHDVFSRGYVGGMATLQGGPGVRGTRLASGADFEFPLLVRGQNVVPAAFVAWSRDSAGATAASAWRIFLDYPNDRMDNFIAVSRVADGFDPALGFVRQAGVWRYTAAVRVFPRPRRFGVRRLLFTLIQADVLTTLGGNLDNASYAVRPIGAEFESGDRLELNLRRVQDVPADDFEIFPGTLVAAGRYRWDRAELGFESSPARPLGADVTVSAGEYYGGTATEVEVGLTLRAAPHLIGSLEGQEQRVRLATGRFAARTVRLRLDYAASPRLGGTVFFQYDNESDRLTVNARGRWSPRPGSEAYLVWNSAWPTGLDRGVPWARPLRGALVGKLVYYFRL